MNKSRIRIISINLALLLVVVAVGWWGWSALHPKAAVVTTTTTTVSMGDVSSTVSASGTVISPGDIGVSPIVNAQITKLNVKVGQRVSAGTLMAVLDNTALANTLSQAKASLETLKINLNQNSVSIETAKSNAANNAITYEQNIYTAKKSWDKAISDAAANKSTLEAAVQSAQNTYDSDLRDRNNYYITWSQYGFTVAYCNTLNLAGLQNATIADAFSHCSTILTNEDTLVSDKLKIASAQLALENGVAKDLSVIEDSKIAYENSLTAQKNGLLKDQAAITTAVQAFAIFKAQQGISSDSPTDKDFSVAQSTMAVAQKNYDATFVRAPVTGTVASISAGVGQNAPTSSSSVVGAVTGFIVLTDVSSLQVSAGFSEADAAKLAVGQIASFSYAALTNVNSTGKLVSIDTLPTTTNGATSYKATFSIDGKVDGLKPGMTATATVKTGSASNVLQVTSQAVSIRGRGATVNVITTKNGKDVITPTPVVVGLQGDSSVQIISGVEAGTKVVLRSNTSSVGTNGFPSVGVPSGLGGAGLAVQGGGGGNGGGRGGRG